MIEIMHRWPFCNRYKRIDNGRMDQAGIVLSPQEAQKISGVLELHICSNIASGASKEMEAHIEKEIEELNKIQKNIESQLDVPRDRRV